MKRIASVLCAIMVFSAAGFLFARGAGDSGETYPARPVEVTMVFGAGSAADTTARKFSDLAQPYLGQPLPVVNRTGGGTSVGYIHARDQKPDGYNIVWTSNGFLTAYYQGSVPFNYDAFRNIARVSYEPISIAVRADAPWKTMEEFFRYIQANPGTVRIGNSGVGTFTHLVAVAIEHRAGSSVVHVPFGQGLAFASLMGGQIEASVQIPSEILAQVDAGELRILAVSSKERIETLPNIPTLKESNVDVEMILWRGLAVPLGTPDNVAKILEEVARKVVSSKEFRDFSDSISIIPAFMPEAEFAGFLAEDDKFIRELMTSIGANTR